MKNIKRTISVFFLLISFVASTGFAGNQNQVSQVKADGGWKGTLDASGTKLDLILHISTRDGALAGTLDSPDQGAAGLPIDSISQTGKSLRFEMKSLGAVYEGVFSEDGSQIEGQFSQQGLRLPLMFKRIAKNDSIENVLKSQKVEVDGHDLQLLVGGQGSPAVIFEAGFGAGLGSWSKVQKDVAAFAQTVSYDRAGIGQSDQGPKPRSAKQIATELHAALQKVGVKPPYVMVGHSFGGIYIRVFADMYPTEVVGMVLIDPSQESFNDWLSKNEPARLKAMESDIAKAGAGVQGEFAALDASYSQARVAKVPGGIPVTLLSATEDDTMPAEARRVWIEKHNEWLATVPGSKHIVVEKASHFIQAQQPAVVIEAIKQVARQPR